MEEERKRRGRRTREGKDDFLLNWVWQSMPVNPSTKGQVDRKFQDSLGYNGREQGTLQRTISELSPSTHGH